MKKGQSAPFAGNLLTDAALAKLIAELKAKAKQAVAQTQRCEKERTAEKTAADAVCKARVAEWQAKHKACESNSKTRSMIFTTALKKANTSPWYKSPVLSFVLGAVVSGGVCVAGATLGR